MDEKLFKIIDIITNYFTAVSAGYSIILVIFTWTVLENESLLLSFYQIISRLFLLCLSLLIYSTEFTLLIDLSNGIKVFIQFILCLLSIYFCYSINKYYVVGEKPKKVDLSGKIYIITGCNTGLGFETAKSIASMNGTIIMACRSIDKANIAREEIIKVSKCSSSKIMVIKLDLCSFDSVRKFVKEFNSLGFPLHCLINNAGVMMKDRCLTDNGLEMVFTANHLSHFLLTNLLLPELEKTDGRIVNLTSTLHKHADSFNFDDIMSEKNYSLFGTYSQSKLANILFTRELQKRLISKNSKVTCNSVHPGCVRTEVTRNMNAFMRIGSEIATPIMMTLQKTPAEGAYNSIHVATSLELKDIGGLYFFHCRAIQVGQAALDDNAAIKLWKISEEITGLSEEDNNKK